MIGIHFVERYTTGEKTGNNQRIYKGNDAKSKIRQRLIRKERCICKQTKEREREREKIISVLRTLIGRDVLD